MENGMKKTERMTERDGPYINEMNPEKWLFRDEFCGVSCLKQAAEHSCSSVTHQSISCPAVPPMAAFKTAAGYVYILT
jgi:uncharacterized cysteine cluster protein YcgN (CxxCxxCC family)